MAKRPVANNFAALFSVTAGKKGKKVKTEEEKEKERERAEGESDEDYDARMAKLDEEEDETEATSAKEDDEDEEEEGGKEKPKGSTKEGDDEKCAAARLAGFNAGAKHGSKAERIRWTETLGSKAAVGRGAQACMMLSTTDMSVAQLGKTLAASPKIELSAAAAPIRGLAARMAETSDAVPKPTGGTADAPAPGTAAATAAAIVAAAKTFDPKGRG